MYLEVSGLAFHASCESYMWRDWGVNVERLGSKYGEIGELMWRDWGVNVERLGS